jgi:imidazolonepropionase-like amidohydrolase
MKLENANVVDVESGQVLRGYSMEIADGKITAIEKHIFFTDDGIDCTDLYLLPGLISVHSHLSVVYPFSALDESENSAQSVLRALSRARDALMAGVTTVRSVHEVNMADLHLRYASESGLVEIPRIFGAGRALSTTGGHGKGAGCVYVDGYDEFFQAATAEMEKGADHIKVFISGGIADAHESLEGAQMSMDEMRGVVDAANAKGKYVVAHAANSESISLAVDAGFRSFEHAYFLDEETAKKMKKHNVFLTPTLCVTRSPEWMADHSFTKEQIDKAMEIGPTHLNSIRNAIKAGVTIVAGTDYPPGEAIQDTFVAAKEMEFLVEAGASPLQALQAGTSTAAKLLGADKSIGKLEVGMLADVIACRKDPISDLSAIRDIDLIIQEGKIIRNTIIKKKS